MRTIIYLAAFSLALCGCARNIDTKDLTPITGTLTQTEIIRDKAAEAATVAPQVKPQMTDINKAANNIDGYQQKTTDVVNALQKENDKLKEELDSALRKQINLIIIASTITVGLSIALFFLGSIKSLTITVSAAGVLLAAIMLKVALAYMLWLAIGASVLIAAAVVYSAYLRRHSIQGGTNAKVETGTT